MEAKERNFFTFDSGDDHAASLSEASSSLSTSSFHDNIQSSTSLNDPPPPSSSSSMPTTSMKTTTITESEHVPCAHRVPLELLCDHLTPFLDRSTFNNFMAVNKQTYKVLSQHESPPWPRKVVSRDHLCRVRCLTFSVDGTQLACGCTDGMVRVWHVKDGERSSPFRAHMYGQSVLAVAFSNDNGRSYIASSSTDHTIRIFDVQQDEERIRRKQGGGGLLQRSYNSENSNHRSLTATADDGDDTNNEEEEEESVNICISAGHAYCLSFSPDDTYLVSGHYLSEPRRGAGVGRTAPSETISIWDVGTGHLLRAIRGGGMPVSFVTPHMSLRSSSSSSPSRSQCRGEHLVSASSDDCLILWNLGQNKPNAGRASFLDRRRRHGLPNDNPNDPLTVRQTSTSNDSRCVRRWFLGSYNTVMPCPTEDDSENIMVATIDETKSHMFSVWHTSDPTQRRSFTNVSPYEIRISSNGTKVASVDDFSKVKVWRISDGKLLSTFDGFTTHTGKTDNINHNRKSCSDDEDYCSITSFSRSSSSTLFDDSDHNSITSRSDDDDNDDGADDVDVDVVSSNNDRGENDEERRRTRPSSSPMGGRGIHEIAFAKDSTVAVVSRHYNEIYLFDT